MNVTLDELSVSTGMEFTVVLLSNFGIRDESVVKRFIDEHIEFSYFPFLSESDLRDLMPKMIDRVKIRKGFQEFENLNNDPLSSKSPSPPKTHSQIDLLNLLKKSSRGQYILDLYDRESSLTPDARSKLVDIVADEVMRLGLPTGNKATSEIAKLICKLFPFEEEKLYYLAPRSRGKEQTHSAGLLKNKFANFTRKLKSKPDADILNVTDIDEIFRVEDEPDEVLWLKVNTGPWIDICDRWQQTTSWRVDRYNGKNLDDIIKSWPILKHPDAFQLISIDFRKQYPDKELHLTEKWHSFVADLKTILKKNYDWPFTSTCWMHYSYARTYLTIHQFCWYSSCCRPFALRCRNVVM